MALASRAFPVLRPEDLISLPKTDRRTAFHAVVTLLEHLAAREGLVLLAIDDLHWADDDAIALLQRIVEAAPAHVAVVARLRDDVGRTPAEIWLVGHPKLPRFDVGPLDIESLRALVDRVLQERGSSWVRNRSRTQSPRVGAFRSSPSSRR
ncbi:MAG: hypothetical protein ACOC1F_05260 [Myxococcota bacterium]